MRSMNLLAFFIFFLILGTGSATANAANRYYFPEGLSGSPGDTVVIPVWGANDVELKGYSVCVKFDPDIFEVDTLTLAGTRGEGAVMFMPGWTDTTAKAGVVYTYSCPGIQPDSGVILNIVMHIKDDAPIGATSLELRDVDPAKNRMTPCEGSVITPSLVEGSFQVAEPLAGDRYYFPEGLNGSPGDTVVIPVWGANDVELKGYSVCVKFDPDIFEVDTLTLAGTRGEGAVMFMPGWTDTTAKAGVVYTYSCPGIQPDSGVILNIVMYIKDDAPMGTTVLRLRDVDPAKNRMTPCEGSVITPNLANGNVWIKKDGINSEEDSPFPVRFGLFQNYPNPFNSVTEIGYSLLRDGHVRLGIYNLLGQKVATLVEARETAGYKSVHFDASSLASGIYFYHLQAGNFVETRKFILLK